MQRATADGNRPGPLLTLAMTKDIITGIALTALIAALAFAVPLVGFFFVMLVPAPMIFFRTKLGRNGAGVIAGAVALAGVLLAGGATLDIFLLIALFLLGLGLGERFEHNDTIEKTVCLAAIGVWGASLVLLIFYSVVSDTDIMAQANEYLAVNLAHTLALYREMGMPAETIEMLERSMPQIQYVLLRIIPGLVMASTLFVAWLNILIAKAVHSSRGLRFPDFGSLNRWKAPEMMIWFVIAAGGMMLIPDRTVKIFGINALLVFFVVYFFQGIAIVSFFFEKKKLPILLRVILYCLIGVQQLLLFLVVGMGFFDVWLDLRKLNSAQEPVK